MEGVKTFYLRRTGQGRDTLEVAHSLPMNDHLCENKTQDKGTLELAYSLPMSGYLCVSPTQNPAVFLMAKVENNCAGFVITCNVCYMVGQIRL